MSVHESLNLSSRLQQVKPDQLNWLIVSLQFSVKIKWQICFLFSEIDVAPGLAVFFQNAFIFFRWVELNSLNYHLCTFLKHVHADVPDNQLLMWRHSASQCADVSFIQTIQSVSIQNRVSTNVQNVPSLRPTSLSDCTGWSANVCIQNSFTKYPKCFQISVVLRFKPHVTCEPLTWGLSDDTSSRRLSPSVSAAL